MGAYAGFMGGLFLISGSGSGARPTSTAAATQVATAAAKQAATVAAKQTTTASASSTSRFTWMVGGMLLKQPILAGVRFLGTRIALGGPLGKLVGSALLLVCSVAEFDFSGATDIDEPEVPLDPSPLPRVALRREAVVPIPKSWQAARDPDRADVACHKYDAGEPVRKALEAGMHATAHDSCAGRDGTGHTRKARIISVQRIENLKLWKGYHHRKCEMTDAHHAHNVRVKPLDPKPHPIALDGSKNSARMELLDQEGLLEFKTLNEVFLYHGTTAEVADIVAHHGFDERVAKLDGLYGAGIYFANQSCKAAQYAKDPGVKTLIVARVALGDPYYADSTWRSYGTLSASRRPPDRPRADKAKGLTYDSIVANESRTQIHREFMLYDRRQAYPEYIVRFREG